MNGRRIGGGRRCGRVPVVAVALALALTVSLTVSVAAIASMPAASQAAAGGEQGAVGGERGAVQADPASDAPETPSPTAGFRDAADWATALQTWQDAGDVNAWIGARFRYDLSRALALSESERARGGAFAIVEPAAFFTRPEGVCVDLARFAVETMRIVDPASRPRYLMIEFDPVTLGGQVLRRHWVVLFEHEGALYVFGDSKRPGHVAGPYPELAAFVDEYARYRGRRIVAVRETDTTARRMRVRARGAAETVQPR